MCICWQDSNEWPGERWMMQETEQAAQSLHRLWGVGREHKR